MNNEFHILDINQNKCVGRDVACNVCTTVKQNAIYVSNVGVGLAPTQGINRACLWVVNRRKNRNRSIV